MSSHACAASLAETFSPILLTEYRIDTLTQVIKDLREKMDKLDQEKEETVAEMQKALEELDQVNEKAIKNVASATMAKEWIESNGCTVEEVTKVAVMQAKTKEAREQGFPALNFAAVAAMPMQPQTIPTDMVAEPETPDFKTEIPIRKDLPNLSIIKKINAEFIVNYGQVKCGHSTFLQLMNQRNWERLKKPAYQHWAWRDALAHLIKDNGGDYEKVAEDYKDILTKLQHVRQADDEMAPRYDIESSWALK